MTTRPVTPSVTRQFMQQTHEDTKMSGFSGCQSKLALAFAWVSSLDLFLTDPEEQSWIKI